MDENTVYGDYLDVLGYIKDDLEKRINAYSAEYARTTGEKLFEHFTARVKSEESMREKLERKGLELTPRSALREVRDSIGIRIICSFVDDVYTNAEKIKAFDNIRVVEEKDYIRHAKPNGYRSYHLICEVEAPFPDIDGRDPGRYFCEIQLRTIAMDSWASLEHEMKYKKSVKDQELVVAELKRVADELASCDLSMQTIKNIIRERD